jgi:penicillin-binding protein 2
VFDYWLLGQYPSEDDITATQRGQSSSPIGKPRAKKDVPLLSPKAVPADQALEAVKP